MADLGQMNLAYKDMAFAAWGQLQAGAEAQLRHHFAKYGDQRLDVPNWLCVIVEEEGEAVQAFNDRDLPQALFEIEQVVACWSRLYLEIQRMTVGKDEEERALYSRAK